MKWIQICIEYILSEALIMSYSWIDFEMFVLVTVIKFMIKSNLYLMIY